MRDQGDTVNVEKRPEPVDWKLCTCRWSYTGGQEGPTEDVRWDVNLPELIQVDPNCPERAKPGHPG